MNEYKVKLFSGSETILARYYTIDSGGVLTFWGRDQKKRVSFNGRIWSEVREVSDE